MLAALLLLAALAEEEKPEPGILDPGVARVEPPRVAARRGTAREAADLFYAAHALQKKGEPHAALARYIEFQAVEGARELPERFRTMARERAEKLLAQLARECDEACALYRTDRRRGLDALRALAERGPALPHGRAARVLVQSDALKQAITDARAFAKEGKRAEAARSLEAAVRATPEALYRFEARSLLVEVGGPDLFEPGERVGGGKEKGPGEEGTTPKRKDESGIDVSKD
jgi:hypothetical protein